MGAGLLGRKGGYGSRPPCSGSGSRGMMMMMCASINVQEEQHCMGCQHGSRPLAGGAPPPPSKLQGKWGSEVGKIKQIPGRFQAVMQPPLPP